jgi:hypothetical protein
MIVLALNKLRRNRDFVPFSRARIRHLHLPLRLAAISSSMNPNSADQMELMRLKMSQEKLDSETPLGTGATAWMGEEAIGHSGPFEPQGSGK